MCNQLPAFLKIKKGAGENEEEIKLKNVFKSNKTNKSFRDACCDALFKVSPGRDFFKKFELLF